MDRRPASLVVAVFLWLVAGPASLVSADDCQLRSAIAEDGCRYAVELKVPDLRRS
jgi:hypothetical protein